jgi:hypothetical protein
VAKKDRLQLYDICDYRALAMALVKKCTLTIPSLYDGERNQPWNIIPEFGGAPPAADKIKWHGRPDYDFLLPDIDDPVKLTGRFPARVNLVEWPLLASQHGIVVADTNLPHLFYHFFCVPVVRRQLGRLHVHAADSGTLRAQCRRLGFCRPSADVSSFRAAPPLTNARLFFSHSLWRAQLPFFFSMGRHCLFRIYFRIRDPAPELEELFCRQTPGPRAHHSMVMFEERLYLLGGKRSDSSFHADAWYRGENVLLLWLHA